MEAPNGIVLVDKPVGLTSFGVVARVRGALTAALAAAPPAGAGADAAAAGPADGDGRAGGRRARRLKCGHAGSLDPMATGLLVVMCGRGTRLSPFLMGLDKRYRATVRFGVGTDTLDVDGRVTARRPVTFAPEDLARVLPEFTGRLAQVPPAFSAVKRQGRRLYELARRGLELPEIEPKPVTISALELTGAAWGREPAAAAAGPADADAAAAAPAQDGLLYEAELTVDCSSGTYVRSLARDLAAALGTVGFVARLRRERVGPFTVAEALPPERLQDGRALAAAIRPLAASLPHLPRLEVSEREARLLAQGGQPEIHWLRRLRPPPPPEPGRELLFAVVGTDGALVAVGRVPAAGGLPRTAAVLATAGPEGR